MSFSGSDRRGLVVVNAAAWANVDTAEADEAGAYAVNAEGPAALAGACGQVGARLVHVSTDYVFAGDAAAPYDEKTRPAPRTAYGRTKAAGEQAVLTSGADVFVVVDFTTANQPVPAKTMLKLVNRVRALR